MDLTQLTEEQQRVVAHEGPCLVLGAAGTGKTMTLVARVKALLDKGQEPETIYIVAFSLRSSAFLKGLLEKYCPKAAKNLKVGTILDFSRAQMEAKEDAPLNVASYVVVRRALRHAMQDTDFEGTYSEAEHLIRQFKARARRPQESEKFYDLFEAFRRQLEKEGVFDRYDIVRKHIVGMRNDVYQPCAMRHVLVDNVQDATQIQLRWLFEHLLQGVTLVAFANDDAGVFGLDGALGADVIHELGELEQLERFSLSGCFRSPARWAAAFQDLVKPLKRRVQKDTVYMNKDKGVFALTEHENVHREMAALVEWVQNALKRPDHQHIAVLVRQEFQAQRVHIALEKEGVAHSCIAPSLWDAPGAIMVLDLLEVLLNTAGEAQLRNVLIGFGLNTALVDSLFASGLIALDWLKNGASLPDGVDVPQPVLQTYGPLQRRLVGYYNAMMAGSIRPRDLFKAASYDLIESLNDEDQRDALLAIETLVSLKGKLVDILPDIRAFKTPDLTARVIVSPIREVRNMEFDAVILPFMSDTVFPYAAYTVLSFDDGHERRVLNLALSRAKHEVQVLYSGSVNQWVKAFGAGVT